MPTVLWNGHNTRIRLGNLGAESTLWRCILERPRLPDDPLNFCEVEVVLIAAESEEDVRTHLSAEWGPPSYSTLKIACEGLVTIVSASPLF
jgi:hypothetical protein